MTGHPMSDVERFFEESMRPRPPAWALTPSSPTPDMWAFIDDSGDPGMKLDNGSSKYIVIAACIFRDPKQIEALKQASQACAERRGHRTEFKFSKTKERTKNAYFESVAGLSYSVRAIYADKRRLHSPKLRSDGSSLKSYLIKQLLVSNYGEIRNAKVIIDGSDLGAFGISDQQYLTGLVNRDNPGTVHTVKFTDSKNNCGIQLADMTAGAINRYLVNDRKNAERHFSTFRSRTWQPRGTLWHFTK